MEGPPPLAIDANDAMTIVIVASNAWVSLPMDDLPAEMRQGVILLYDAIVRQIKPQLPREGAMQHVFDLIAGCERTSADIRKRLGLPPVV